MLNMLDDCSRLFVGSKLYDRELLLSYFDFLPAAFPGYGRPLQIYVDYHAIFFTQNPEALTQLGWALKFYDISFLYAPTPQAKGKIEREHQFWQGRLPPYFASEQITEIETANPHIDALRLHRNAHETHRELRHDPATSLGTSPRKKNVPSCAQPRDALGGLMFGASAPTLKVGSDGRVPIGTQRLRVEHPAGRQSRPLPPSHRPSFRPGRATRLKKRNRRFFSPIAQNEPVLVC